MDELGGKKILLRRVSTLKVVVDEKVFSIFFSDLALLASTWTL